MISKLVANFNIDMTDEDDLRVYMDEFTLEDWIYILHNFRISDNFIREISYKVKLNERWLIIARCNTFSIKMCYELLNKHESKYIIKLNEYIAKHNKNYNVIKMIEDNAVFYDQTDWNFLMQNFKWSSLFLKKFRKYLEFYNC